MHFFCTIEYYSTQVIQLHHEYTVSKALVFCAHADIAAVAICVQLVVMCVQLVVVCVRTASSGVYTASSGVCTTSSGVCTASSGVCWRGDFHLIIMTHRSPPVVDYQMR